MTPEPTEIAISMMARKARLLALAEQTDDEEQARRLRDAAAEYDGLSLNGAASLREGE